MFEKDPLSPCDARDKPPAEDDLAQLQTAARDLMEAIAAEPVPDRLRELAVALGKALDRHKEELAAARGAGQGR